jgi:hypothetical protein
LIHIIILSVLTLAVCDLHAATQRQTSHDKLGELLGNHLGKVL